MDLPKRKSPRLKLFDYSQNGAYFVTICTKDRRCILGEINTPCSVGEAALCLPNIVLSTWGKIVDSHIKSINDVYPDITVDKYIIMPNHIHLLISINNGRQGAASPTISHIVKGIKSLVTKQIGVNIFQRSFHDHVVRGEKDYLEIWQYIDTNHLKWQEDCFYIQE